MKAFLLSLLMIACLAPCLAAADERLPAGYVLDITLEGADAAEKTVIVRDASELPAKLMMPLYEGDVVFLRDPKSTLSIELGSGETVQLGSMLPRYRVEGQIATGDSTWGVLTAIAGVFAGEGEQAPKTWCPKAGRRKSQWQCAVRTSSLRVRLTGCAGRAARLLIRSLSRGVVPKLFSPATSPEPKEHSSLLPPPCLSSPQKSSR